MEKALAFKKRGRKEEVERRASVVRGEGEREEGSGPPVRVKVEVQK